MGKKTLSARVDAKTKQDVRELAEERDISISNMTQQLVRDSIKKEKQETVTDGGHEVRQLQNKLKEAELVAVIGIVYGVLVYSLNPAWFVSIPIGLLIIASAFVDLTDYI